MGKVEGKGDAPDTAGLDSEGRRADDMQLLRLVFRCIRVTLRRHVVPAKTPQIMRQKWCAAGEGAM